MGGGLREGMKGARGNYRGCANGSSILMTTSAPRVGKKQSIVMLVGIMLCTLIQLGLM